MRKLLVFLVCLLLCGCGTPMARLYFFNKTSMDLTIRMVRMDYYSDIYEDYEGVPFQRDSQIDWLFFQNMDYLLRLTSSNQSEKKYKIHTRKKGGYTRMYIKVLPDWTLAVYDSKSDLKSPIDKAQYLILPLNSENETQQE